MPKTRFIFFIQAGARANPKECCIPQADTCSYVLQTFKWIFDYKDEDIFYCTADIGWVTVTAISFMDLSQQARQEVMFEGVPNYPKPDSSGRSLKSTK